VAVDLAERPTVTTRSPEDHQSVVAPLTARIETLEAEFAKVEAAAAVHRADFERERERCERLMAEVLKTTAELMAAREAIARIAGELAAFQARPWWRRLVG
jgi:chromosome segregation ATPase